jgi:hypothetical protein
VKGMREEGDQMINQKTQMDRVTVKGYVEPSKRRGQTAINARQSVLTADAADRVMSAVRGFAEGVDWRCCPPAQDPAAYFRKNADSVSITASENDEALRVGKYIRLNITPPSDSVKLQGGRYDAYHQPNTVWERSLSLSGATDQEMEKALKEMYRALRVYKWKAV